MATASKKPRAEKKAIPLIRRFRRNYRWSRTALEPYKLIAHAGGDSTGASRQILIGKGKEQCRFHVRYFELDAGGHTSLERHKHAHVVIGIRGRGRARIEGRSHAIGFLDTLYIGPEQAHQLAAPRGEKFGFLCMVDARRDRPRPVKGVPATSRRQYQRGE